MRYVVIRENDYLKHFWCYYTECETCNKKFTCFTNAVVIIDDCIDRKVDDIIEILRKHGIHTSRYNLAEF